MSRYPNFQAHTLSTVWPDPNTDSGNRGEEDDEDERKCMTLFLGNI